MARFLTLIHPFQGLNIYFHNVYEVVLTLVSDFEVLSWGNGERKSPLTLR